MICLTLIQLLTHSLPHYPQFASELQRQVLLNDEVVIEHVEKQHYQRFKQIINGIPGIVVRNIQFDESECQITVGKIYGY